jgi:hypothetical protein
LPSKISHLGFFVCLAFLRKILFSSALLDSLDTSIQLEVNYALIYFTLMTEDLFFLVICGLVYTLGFNLLLLVVIKLCFYFSAVDNRPLVERINATYFSLKERFELSRKNETYEGLVEFWTKDFFLRKKESFVLFFLEIPFLNLLSFFTYMRVRLPWLQNLILLRGFFLFFVFGDYTLLALYMGTTIILTLFVLFPPINLHIRNMYGEFALRKLGWNGPLDNVLVQGKTAARIAAGGIGLGVVYKGGTITMTKIGLFF